LYSSPSSVCGSGGSRGGGPGGPDPPPLFQGLDPALCGALCGGWITLVSSSSLCHNSTNGMYLSPSLPMRRMDTFVKIFSMPHKLPSSVDSYRDTVGCLKMYRPVVYCLQNQQNFYKLFVLIEQVNGFRFLWLIVV